MGIGMYDVKEKKSVLAVLTSNCKFGWTRIFPSHKPTHCFPSSLFSCQNAIQSLENIISDGSC